MVVRAGQVASVIERLRDDYPEIGTIPVNVEKLVRALGIVLFKQDFGSDLSGAAMIRGERRIISINTNKREPETRQRFTLAHELGHMLLHSDQAVNVDIKPLTLFRDASSSTGQSWREVEANLFAANLLMPEAEVSSYFYQYSAKFVSEDLVLDKLAKKFAVSTHAMGIRLHSLKLIAY